MPPARLRQLRPDAERLAAALPPLMPAVLRVVATVQAGLHGRRRPGSGDSFWQYRAYQPGDSLRRIDWRRSARGDHLFVRENEWQAAQSLWIWHDASPSMQWSSSRNLAPKAERAAIVMLAIGALLLDSGERVGWLDDRAPPLSGMRGLGKLIERRGVLDAQKPDAAPSGLNPRPLPRHAQVVLAGDFLDPLEQIEESWVRLAAGGVRGHVLHVLDPAEISLPFTGRLRLQGLEGEGEVILRRAESVNGAYRRRMDSQRAGLADLARRLGWTLTTHITDHPPQGPVLALHQALSLAPDAR